MRESPAEIATGAVVLAVAGAFVAYALSTGGASFGTGERYELTASFRSVEGVVEGTDIRLAGVTVGSVSDIALNPQTFRADTTLSIDSGIEVPLDSAVVVASEGLLGGTFVEIVPGGMFDVYQPGDAITDTQGAVSLVQLLMSFVGATDE